MRFTPTELAGAVTVELEKRADERDGTTPAALAKSGVKAGKVATKWADNLVEAIDRSRDTTLARFLEIVTARGGKSAGAIRVSFGLASNFADAERFVQFASSFRDQSRLAIGEATEAKGIDFALRPGGTIVGTVRDTENRPVEGASLFFRDEDGAVVNRMSEIFTDGDPANDFFGLEPIVDASGAVVGRRRGELARIHAGAGGGNAGDSITSDTFPPPIFAFVREGGGGGGGGGALHIRALGRIVFGPLGRNAHRNAGALGREAIDERPSFVGLALDREVNGVTAGGELAQHRIEIAEVGEPPAQEQNLHRRPRIRVATP